MDTKELDKDDLMLMEPTSSWWTKTTERKYSMTSPNQEWMEMEGKEGAQLVAAAVPSATD